MKKFSYFTVADHAIDAQPYWSPQDITCSQNPCENGGVCLNIRRPKTTTHPETCGPTSCYKVVQQKLSWTDAETACQQNGGHLAAFETTTEQNDVGAFIANNELHIDKQGGMKFNYFWTSGVYNKQFNDWFWNSTGSLVSVAQSPTPSTNSDEGKCLAASSDSVAELSVKSQSCLLTQYFVCELSKAMLAKGRLLILTLARYRVGDRGIPSRL
ncbi:Snaclec stejaggregin-A subunit beta-3 [Holothuria leucospilota]|uniref:Snaclec stejaggregin-A subunit beta-3 n=1 Tax=Holothuria leucospilota TaxID=206669 RepID=A0A9Q1C9A0_HOLLE|nr:Snaclec stejaggregin-A subunit beta-3 [Holothuria leucospilota]